MTTATIRKRLYDYIMIADDKKIKAIYTLPEDQLVPEGRRSVLTELTQLIVVSLIF